MNLQHTLKSRTKKNDDLFDFRESLLPESKWKAVKILITTIPQRTES